MTPGATWPDYYEKNEGRDPREPLLRALDAFDGPGQAVDLGCGSGIDTLALLARGWRVVAVDAQADAVRRLRGRVPAEMAERVETRVAPMEEVDLPPVDLVHASYSLFFCDPGRFPDVWTAIARSLVPDGMFVGELLGDRDTWAGEDDITAFTESQARALFEGWTVERFEEEDEDGEACDGPKHWHVFHVTARAPGDLRDDRP